MSKNSDKLNAATLTNRTEESFAITDFTTSELLIETFRVRRTGQILYRELSGTKCGVRLTHITTGIVVECQEDFNGYRNRESALQLLRIRLNEIAKK
ncbi:protein subunit release factor A [Undibacterium sp. GrIS 1.8]